VADFYSTLVFSDTFLAALNSKDFTRGERKQLMKALLLLDRDERHPSLRVHELRGDLTGTWSASASKELRITFERAPEGGKRLLACSHHYSD
jgi:mRNA-degrading endonuclease YafQ of YafQ-DinJ toxin-antitoxin module